MPILLGDGRAQQKRDFLYWEYPEKGGQIAIRAGKWKGGKLGVQKKGYRNVPWMIFDLEKDVQESTDLSSQYPDLVKYFDSIVQQEHKPAYVKEWEFIAPKFAR